MATPPPLDVRLQAAIIAWIGTPIPGESSADLEAARSTINALVKRQREEDTVITPESDATKAPRLVLNIDDTGRTKPYAPLRNLRVMLAIRGNAQVPAGNAAAFTALTGALEYLLDNSNLTLAWDTAGAGQGVRVMRAFRAPGIHRSVAGDVRTTGYGVEVRAAGAEHVV
jgi:hypothetical protein